MQLLLFLVSVETQQWPSFELMLNNEHVCVCVCVCEYMKGYGGKLKCQRGSFSLQLVEFTEIRGEILKKRKEE